MKDATATALYGARGANGVILVTTKEGKEGPAKVSFRLENSISAPTQNVELADPITYMQLHNEAVSTRDPLAFRPRSEEHTSELQSLMRISYAVFCLKKKKKLTTQNTKGSSNNR